MGLGACVLDALREAVGAVLAVALRFTADLGARDPREFVGRSGSIGAIDGAVLIEPAAAESPPLEPDRHRELLPSAPLDLHETSPKVARGVSGSAPVRAPHRLRRHRSSCA